MPCSNENLEEQYRVAVEVLRIFSILQRYAICKKTISYTALATEAKLQFWTGDLLEKFNYKNPNHRKDIGALLEAVSCYSYEKNKTLLSVLVVHKGSEFPGDGFINMSEAHELYDSKKETEQQFIERQKKKVFKFYSNCL